MSFCQERHKETVVKADMGAAADGYHRVAQVITRGNTTTEDVPSTSVNSSDSQTLRLVSFCWKIYEETAIKGGTGEADDGSAELANQSSTGTMKKSVMAANTIHWMIGKLPYIWGGVDLVEVDCDGSGSRAPGNDIWE